MSDNEPGQHAADMPTLLVSDKTYELLRFLAVIVLPALGTAYFAAAAIVGLPAAEEVVGIIMVIDTFLGVLVRSLRKSYENSEAKYDGIIEVVPNELEGVTNLNVSLDPEAVAGKDQVLVQIKRA